VFLVSVVTDLPPWIPALTVQAKTAVVAFQAVFSQPLPSTGHPTVAYLLPRNASTGLLLSDRSQYYDVLDSGDETRTYMKFDFFTALKIHIGDY
jgi:hypothetical protein